ncbi:sodium:solute symporter [Bifidobacterium goeldii]|uniref:Sodium:solute symporter n=2 Tax=Bifidobacterium goeldii TaxID=2306975 RepID=A0A430FJT9_9BIFI|nr:sodium:solute symporter [Bifidobacterium goeldii]
MNRTETEPQIITGKIPVVSKLAYGLGDASTTLLRIVIMTYLTFFYTDVAKLDPLAVGTMMLVTQIVNLVSAPVIGVLVDRTHTKRGQSRPWFLGVAVPLGIFGALCFCTPNLSPAWRLAFAYLTYNGYNIANNALHIPLGSILPNMSTDPNERLSANSWRMNLGQCAGALSALITVPLVTWIGQGNEPRGYFGTACLYGAFAVACTLFCYFAIHENVMPEDQAKAEGKTQRQKGSLKHDLAGLKYNLPLYLLLIVDFMNAMFTTISNSGLMYYLKYQVHNVALMPTVSVLSYLAIIVIAAVPTLNKRFTKRVLFIFGLLSIIIGRVVMIAFPSSVIALYIGMIITGLALGFGTALVYTMVADCIDYGEYRTGARSSGLTYSLSSMLEGIATGVGAALVGYVLKWGGYDANLTDQSSSAMTAIHAVFLYIPIACCAVSLIALCFYKLDHKLPEVNKVLAERHADQSAAIAAE